MIFFCVENCMIFFSEWLRDFLCGAVAWFFCVERLHDFCHSLTHSCCMIYFCEECMVFKNGKKKTL